MLYRSIIRPCLFRCDAEWAHDQAIRLGRLAQQVPGLVNLSKRWHRVEDERLLTHVAGIRFPNPIGLAAGYDKSGRSVDWLASLGFGHLEIGSVSAMPSDGNPKPRLWRLPKDRATCVYYGLPNAGAESVTNNLRHQSIDVPLGINLVNTNRGASATSTADEILDDYVTSADQLRSFASYFMLNLSCPNTRDGRSFFDAPEMLEELLLRFRNLGQDVPVFLKLSPDIDESAIDQLLETVSPFDSVRGFMFNLSPVRRDGLTTEKSVWQNMPGAVSGKPSQTLTDQLVASLYQRMDSDRYDIVAAGGVFSADDAYRKLRCGASLVQLLTGLIYEGPSIVRSINQGLVERLEKEGISSLSEIIGTDAK